MIQDHQDRKQTAYIALGSNLPSRAGDREATLRAAIERLRGLGAVTAVSSFYETQPVGDPDQPAFLNAAVALETSLSPAELLAAMLTIERDFGRVRLLSRPKGPRTLDLDLLLVGDLRLRETGLTLPHPAMAERRFVLAPLAEIAPELVHPVLGVTLRELLERLPDDGGNRASGVRKLPSQGS